MRVLAVPLRRSQLMQMPQHERSLFLKLGHASNDLAILMKLSVIFHGDQANPIEVRTQMGMFMLTMRLLCAKLYEGWKVLRGDYCGAAVSRDLRLSPEETRALRRLKKTLQRDGNLIERLRNREFHYDGDQLVTTLDGLDSDLLSYIYVQEAVGNSFNSVAEDLLLEDLARATGETNEVSALCAAFDQILAVTNDFQAVAGSIQVELVRKYLARSLEDLGATEEEVRSAPLDEVKVPFFMDRPQGRPS